MNLKDILKIIFKCFPVAVLLPISTQTIICYGTCKWKCPFEDFLTRGDKHD